MTLQGRHPRTGARPACAADAPQVRFATLAGQPPGVCLHHGFECRYSTTHWVASKVTLMQQKKCVGSDRANADTARHTRSGGHSAAAGNRLIHSRTLGSKKRSCLTNCWTSSSAGYIAREPGRPRSRRQAALNQHRQRSSTRSRSDCSAVKANGSPAGISSYSRQTRAPRRSCCSL